MADEGLVPSHYNQTSSHHASLILEQLNVQRYYGAFCDIILRVEDVDVRLHKCVLAASSARLQSMVYGMRQECGELLSLKDVSLPGFWPILDYIYTGVLKLETASVQEVLMAAQTLEIRDVEKICLEYIKLIQNGASNCGNSGPPSVMPESPAPVQEKVQNGRPDLMGPVPVTSADNTGVVDVAPPPLFTMTSDGALSGQYITPISPAQPRDHTDKHMHPVANHSQALIPVSHSHPATPTAPDMTRTPTPSHIQHHAEQSPMPAPVMPSTPGPSPGAPPHVNFPMPPPPPHLPPPLPPMLPPPLPSTSQPALQPQGLHYPAAHSEQGYNMHSATMPPRGFPGMPIDTNYVEDYLKLIESFQGEPQQLAHQVQQYQQQQQMQQMQHHPTVHLPPPQTLVPHSSAPRSMTPTTPATPQDSRMTQTPIPSTHEYVPVPPPTYQPPPPPLQSHQSNPITLPPLKNDLKVQGQQENLGTVNHNNYMHPPPVTRERVFPSTRASTNPIGHMTAEEVRRTVLNVLSKFDDDEEDTDTTDDCRSRGNKVEQVPPLTSFLNFAPLTQSARDSELGDKCGSSTMSDSQDLYGDLQIVSSDSDLSDQDNIETEGYENTPEAYHPPPDPYHTHHEPYQVPRPDQMMPINNIPLENGGIDPNKKDSLLMRMKKASWPTRSEPGVNTQSENNQILKVGNIEINLDLGALASPPPMESVPADHLQIPKKRGRRKKIVQRDLQANQSQDSIFKDTVKDPSMSNRPLKKRIRLRMKRKFQCLKCGREFVRGEALEAHVEQHEKCELHSCHVCNQKFARISELTRHQREHTAELFKCLECQSEFSNSKQYKLHMDNVHKEMKAFYCTFPGCEYRAAKLSNLEKHMPIHADMKRYHCPLCGKTFAQPNGLRSHQKSCQQERGYLCDICGSKFNYLQSMKSHRLLHTGEKPFDCPDCGARFTDPRNLKRHRRIHENLFPYKCPECDKRFRHSNSLKAHTNTHDRKRSPHELSLDDKHNLETSKVPPSESRASSIQENTKPEQKDPPVQQFNTTESSSKVHEGQYNMHGSTPRSMKKKHIAMCNTESQESRQTYENHYNIPPMSTDQNPYPPGHTVESAIAEIRHNPEEMFNMQHKHPNSEPHLDNHENSRPRQNIEINSPASMPRTPAPYVEIKPAMHADYKVSGT